MSKTEIARQSAAAMLETRAERLAQQMTSMKSVRQSEMQALSLHVQTLEQTLMRMIRESEAQRAQMLDTATLLEPLLMQMQQMNERLTRIETAISSRASKKDLERVPAAVWEAKPGMFSKR